MIHVRGGKGLIHPPANKPSLIAKTVDSHSRRKRNRNEKKTRRKRERERKRELWDEGIGERQM